MNKLDGSKLIPNLQSQILELEKKVFEMSSLLKAERALVNILEPHRLYQIFTSMVKEKLEAGPLSVLLYDEEYGGFHLVHTNGLEDFEDPLFSFRIEEGLLWQNILQSEPFPVTTFSGELHYRSFFEKTALYKLESIIWVPLPLKDQVVGLLTVGNRSDERPYNDEDLNFLKQIATVAAVSINTCNLYVKRKEEKEELDKTFSKPVHAL